MKAFIMALVILLFFNGCTTTEVVYRYPQTYEERREADENPQNNGYIVRHVERTDATGLLAFLYITSLVLDVAADSHTHSRHCHH